MKENESASYEGRIDDLHARIKRLEEINKIMKTALFDAWLTLQSSASFESACATRSPNECINKVNAAMDANRAGLDLETSRRKVLGIKG